MTTVRDLIEDAFREAGVLGLGHTLKAEDYQAGFRRLNWMLAQWNRKRWLIYNLVNYTIDATGATSYSVGPAGNINLPERPDQLHSAFFRRNVLGGSFSVDFDDDFDIGVGSGNSDIELNILPSRPDFNRIKLKRQRGEPGYIYYEPSFPLGTFSPWPVPGTSAVQIIVCFKQPLTAFTSLSQVISLPSEYFAALHYNSAQRFSVAYRRPANPELAALAKDALNVIRKANAQIPLLRMPDELITRNYGRDWSY